MDQSPLLRLKEAAQHKHDSRERYREVIEECVERGYTNTEMAMAAGVSETAIRLFIKRNDIKRIR